MEQIKAKILAYLIQNDGTIKDFNKAVFEVELCFKSLGYYPPTVVINKKSLILI